MGAQCARGWKSLSRTSAARKDKAPLEGERKGGRALVATDLINEQPAAHDACMASNTGMGMARGVNYQYDTGGGERRACDGR